jgi:pimeloyl-ACP methyl ester carboxylesterase
MPAVSFAQVGDLRMAYWEAGAPAPGQPRRAPPVVLCHGFPELAFSWRHQILALAAAGYHVIAPDQRGYGLTGGPDGAEAYDIAHLTGDLVGLLDAKGIDRAIFVGHDWGGLVTWQLPLMHPDRVAGVVGLNTPFIPRLSADPIALFRAAYGEDMYIVFFQTEGPAEALFEADVERTLRFFMRKPGGTQAGFTGGQSAAAQTLAMQTLLGYYKPETDTQQFLSDAELGYFVSQFERGGFRRPIHWYRNFTRNWRAAEHLTQHVPHPALMIMAELDVVLPPRMADGMERYVPDLEKVLIAGSGHWTQQEKPAEVNATLLDWLGRRFG